MSGELQAFYYLSVALAIGLLIGVERGWKEREAEEGGRVAGVRTYFFKRTIILRIAPNFPRRAQN